MILIGKNTDLKFLQVNRMAMSVVSFKIIFVLKAINIKIRGVFVKQDKVINYL